MKIGVCQGTACSGCNSTERLLQLTSNLGVDGIEPFFGNSSAPMLAWSQKEIEAFAMQAGSIGISIPSTAVGIFNNDPALVIPEERERSVELIEKAITFTGTVGGGVMLLCTFIKSNPDTIKKQTCLLDVIRVVEPTARKHGVVIALESPLPAKSLARLVDMAQSDHVGVYYDVGNAAALGFDPVNEIKILGSRICSVHIKDTRGSLVALHLGRGQVKLKASIAALRSIGYNGWLMLETPGDDISLVREDIKMIKRYTGVIS